MGLLITADVEELQEIWLGEEPYELVSQEDAGDGKLLVIVKPLKYDTVVEVLDHGHVRLVDFMGGDLAIVRSARVSYDADWREGDEHKKNSDDRLIGYLMRNGHTSPFEAVQFTFEIKIPIFLARQWHRHRTWSYNEVSARYTTLDMGYYLPEPERIGVQSKDNKQVREFPSHLEPGEEKINQAHILAMVDSMDASWRRYQQLVENGVPTELARIVLPVASYTRYFGTVDLHNLFHFLRLRLHEHAQWEIREYAEAILELITQVCPVAVSHFKEQIGYERV